MLGRACKSSSAQILASSIALPAAAVGLRVSPSKLSARPAPSSGSISAMMAATAAGVVCSPHK